VKRELVAEAMIADCAAEWLFDGEEAA